MKTQLAACLAFLLLGSGVARADENAGDFIEISNSQAPANQPTQVQPASTSMGALISPVNAPVSFG